MANPEHLAVLRQGVNVWNEWRLRFPAIKPDVSHADLRDKDLHGIDLRHTKLTDVKLFGSNLKEAVLTGSDLEEGDLRHTDFSKANLQGAFLKAARFADANLRNSNLRGAVLTSANLNRADLNEASMRSAFLNRACLVGTKMNDVELIGANFEEAELGQAHHRNRTTLRHSNLRFANFGSAKLVGIDFNDANLGQANMTGSVVLKCDFTNAYLGDVNLSGATIGNCILNKANLEKAKMTDSVFANLDMSQVLGLESTIHIGPSSIGLDTIYLSKGRIPVKFLRGIGAPDNFIEYVASLTAKSIEYYSCFISYSSANQDFADRVHTDLQASNVRCWLATEDLKIGDKFRTRIEESIRMHDKLLIVLSGTSVASRWVESEVEAAMERERRENRLVLFPVRLDDAIMDTNVAWASEIRRTRHIGDFRNWKDHDSFKKAIDRLLRDLKAESNR